MEGPQDDTTEKITAFFQRPQTILRLISILFAIIVFGCISAGGYSSVPGSQLCLFNGDSGACHYGVGIGVIAFLACIAFLAIDLQFDTITSPDSRKYVTLGDLAFSGFWCFLWFVGFCYLADMWRRTNSKSFSTTQENNCQAAICFSFFSIITWAGLTIMAVSKYRRLLSEFEYSRHQLPGDSYSSPYASFPTSQGEGDPYQSKPFTDQQTDTTPGEDTSNDFLPPQY